jgi:hypothetical protein
MSTTLNRFTPEAFGSGNGERSLDAKEPGVSSETVAPETILPGA